MSASAAFAHIRCSCMINCGAAFSFQIDSAARACIDIVIGVSAAGSAARQPQRHPQPTLAATTVQPQWRLSTFRLWHSPLWQQPDDLCQAASVSQLCIVDNQQQRRSSSFSRHHFDTSSSCNNSSICFPSAMALLCHCAHSALSLLQSARARTRYQQLLQQLLELQYERQRCACHSQQQPLEFQH